MTNELPLNTPVMFYDGYCGFCNGVVRFLLRIDRSRELLFAPMQSDLGQTLIERHHLGSLETAFIAMRTELGESVWIKSSQAKPLVHHVGFLWGLCARLILIVPRPIRDLVYDLIAHNRYKLFGRYDTCPLPPAEVRTRFIHMI